MINKKLLEILVCPQCKGELEYNEKKSVLICWACGLAYPVKDDIPIMLIEEAKPYKRSDDENR